jgi:hypothetical protein
LLILGEVHSGLLQNRSPLSVDLAVQVLELVLGEAVLVSERPIQFVQSPSMLAGVDCGLPVTAGKPMRGIGTVAAQASLVGGHVVQGSAHVLVAGTDRTHRLPWSYYLAKPGVVETAGRTPGPEVAEAFLAAGRAPETLDLGAIAARVVDQVQAAELLDRRSKIKVVRTRLRWVAEADDEGRGVRVEFGVDADGFRTLRLRTGPIAAADPVAVCADVALHDWLLTALIELVRKSALGVIPRREALDRLVPAVDYLLHLWMPAARLSADVQPVWDALERRPGFTRQWETLIRRIRDQLSVGAATGSAAVA